MDLFHARAQQGPCATMALMRHTTPLDARLLATRSRAPRRTTARASRAQPLLCIELHRRGPTRSTAAALQATCSLFARECADRGCTLHEHGFKLSYSTTIPQHSGLAGSSAIITAALNCLLQWYGVEDAWPARERPTFVLRVEQEELGIAAGLMDRVAQVRAPVAACGPAAVQHSAAEDTARAVGGRPAAACVMWHCKHRTPAAHREMRARRCTAAWCT